MSFPSPASSALTAPVVETEGLVRSFGGRTVLDGISLRIERGELFGLLGPSGSGKTTLIKLITGIDRADTGTVLLLGERMPKLSMLQRFGYMAQADALYGELTARENLQFFASLYGLSGIRRSERIQAVMAVVDLLDHLNKPVSAYSGGMKRRLSLAIALLHEPELLVLDEPTVGIDPVLRQSIWKELLALRDNGTTILLTTHVMDEAEKCDRIGLIRDGCLTAVDTPEALKTRSGAQSLEEAFITLGGGERA
ncbi:ABC transporter ATP-binding protein [Cohnella lubricantis]|uniref:ABC transporter ATP-binding protein n=1 Tax=Cohnella lubricantis TaxID=2163172 RepID=A0A841T9B9_9BACL|nr:ABC transporter ATP-binding protein [Cohnella lubricantis]MBB6676659.1 ABC transporter ATP-binding protein [Cohnella lubricantis]MBP2120423.1 ABC-2 type transport system ATP-binding protein [Cohnella lubricantis]